MKSKISIQEMLDSVNGKGARVEEITARLIESSYESFTDEDWLLNSDICEGILESRWERLDNKQIFERLFEVFSQWPTYSTARFIFHHFLYGNIEPENEKFLWGRMIMELASGSDPHVEAIEYVLWVDFFEEPETSARSWNGLMQTVQNDKVKRIILINSGPVPYKEKKKHYEKLFENSEKHELLAQCLALSHSDVYGDLDNDDAKRMLSQLKVDPENKYMDYLLGQL